MTGAVHIGFEVGTGVPVEIPLRHLAVTGMTQEAGKTTALEALVLRAGATALTFVTKRGESSFRPPHRQVQPYFRDRADWQFVSSIIDATLQEKNKFLRPWIMRICRTTKTLADVQAKVREALRTAKGINEGVYTQLDAYLDLIVPEIRRSPLALTMDLRPGLNVMDVSASPSPMQMLFVQSAIDWINEHAEHTIVVVPEAWEFIPEGASSPVKASAIALARKGASVGNRIWIDSQDMAGVDKTMLRACAVWLIGVQREANEIGRNLANIPASVKRPKAAAVATLGRGQFFACWGTHCIKTYVQPAWMSPQQAVAIAIGDRPVESVAKPEHKEAKVTPDEAAKLRQENADLKGTIDTLKRTVAELERKLAIPVSASTAAMLTETDSLYEDFKARLLRDAPALLRVLSDVPELEVKIERRVIEASGDTLRGRLALLIRDRFFDEAKTANTAYNELQRRGFKTAKPNVYREADNLSALGFLTKEDGGYRAVAEMKINVVSL